MPKLFGNSLTRREIAARSGALLQFGGVRLMTLGDGLERGIRMLEFRTGTGLRFTVLVDRAMDIAEVEHNGRAIGWHSPAGFPHPALYEYEGEDGFAWARSFSGFLVTCGLDHILGPQRVPADNYGYPGRSTIGHSLHGRIGMIPARLTGYGEEWDGDRCTLWAEGIVQQAAVFGENLQLHRRIEVDLGSDEIRLGDRVVNAGFVPTPHMFFYHVNVGYPVLDEGSRYLAPITEVLWAAHSGERYQAQGIGYDRIPEPQAKFIEQVWQHETAADRDDEVPVAVVNDRLGLGIEVVTRKTQLPCLYQWQNFQAGAYALGIEPSTHHVLGDLAARERGEMIWLNALEECRYDTTFRVLDGAKAISDCEAAIRAIVPQPSETYPVPTGRFPTLTGRPQYQG